MKHQFLIKITICRHELGAVRAFGAWQGLVLGTFWASGRLVLLAAIGAYLLLGYQMSAEKVSYSNPSEYCTLWSFLKGKHNELITKLKENWQIDIHFLKYQNFFLHFQIFVAMALYNGVRLPLTLFLPLGIQFLFEAKVATDRIENILLLDEHKLGKFF